MKILYISGDDPRKPCSTGSQIRTMFLFRALQTIGDVHVAVAKDRGRKWGVCERLFVMLTKEGEWPFKTEKNVRAQLEIGEEEFDLVVTRYMRNAARFAAWKIAPLIVDIDDVPTQAFLNIGVKRIPCGLKTFCTLLVKAWQRYVLAKCKSVWICKKGDSECLPDRLSCGVLPNLAREAPESFVVSGKQEKIVLTVGLMGYGPNSAGVNWFLDNIWPRFFEQHSDWIYMIAGGGASESDKNKWKTVPGVKLLGFVQDLESVYERASIVVAPINTGAGTCIKVIESALRGRMTFATPAAARGLSEEDIDRLGMKIFCCASSFDAAFEYWDKNVAQNRIEVQESIKSAAQEFNSFERFCKTVRAII